MRLRVLMIAAGAVWFFASSISVFSQTVPAAIGPGGRPFTVGAGISENFLDFTQGSRMTGVTAWADWRCFAGNRWLNRAAIEFEGRDVNMLRPSSLPDMRLDTAEGGLNLTILTGNRSRFYAKGLVGVGSIDVPPGTVGFNHKTQDIFALGEGLDIRLNSFFTLQVDEETQVWRNFFPLGSALTPSSVTVGLLHTFGRNRRERPSYY